MLGLVGARRTPHTQGPDEHPLEHGRGITYLPRLTQAKKYGFLPISACYYSRPDLRMNNEGFYGS